MRSNADYLAEQGYDRYKPEPTSEEEREAHEQMDADEQREARTDFDDPKFTQGQLAAALAEKLGIVDESRDSHE